MMESEKAKTEAPPMGTGECGKPSFIRQTSVHSEEITAAVASINEDNSPQDKGMNFWAGVLRHNTTGLADLILGEIAAVKPEGRFHGPQTALHFPWVESLNAIENARNVDILFICALTKEGEDGREEEKLRRSEARSCLAKLKDEAVIVSTDEDVTIQVASTYKAMKDYMNMHSKRIEDARNVPIMVFMGHGGPPGTLCFTQDQQKPMKDAAKDIRDAFPSEVVPRVIFAQCYAHGIDEQQGKLHNLSKNTDEPNIEILYFTNMFDPYTISNQDIDMDALFRNYDSLQRIDSSEEINWRIPEWILPAIVAEQKTSDYMKTLYKDSFTISWMDVWVYRMILNHGFPPKSVTSSQQCLVQLQEHVGNIRQNVYSFLHVISKPSYEKKSFNTAKKATDEFIMDWYKCSKYFQTYDELKNVISKYFAPSGEGHDKCFPAVVVVCPGRRVDPDDDITLVLEDGEQEASKVFSDILDLYKSLKHASQSEEALRVVFSCYDDDDRTVMATNATFSFIGSRNKIFDDPTNVTEVLKDTVDNIIARPSAPIDLSSVIPHSPVEESRN